MSDSVEIFESVLYVLGFLYLIGFKPDHNTHMEVI